MNECEKDVNQFIWIDKVMIIYIQYALRLVARLLGRRALCCMGLTLTWPTLTRWRASGRCRCWLTPRSSQARRRRMPGRERALALSTCTIQVGVAETIGNLYRGKWSSNDPPAPLVISKTSLIQYGLMEALPFWNGEILIFYAKLVNPLFGFFSINYRNSWRKQGADSASCYSG